MAEAFHQWVANMPWWEKLYYELFDPQAITCSTHYTIPGIYFVGPIIGLVVVTVALSFALGWWGKKLSLNSDNQSRSEE